MNPIRTNWSRLLRHSRLLFPYIRQLPSRFRLRPGHTPLVKLVVLRLRLPEQRLQTWSRRGMWRRWRPKAWWLVIPGGLAFAVVLLTGLSARPASSDIQSVTPGILETGPSTGTSSVNGPGTASPSLTVRQGSPALPLVPATDAPNPRISVWMSQSGRIQTMTLEQYVRGVVAAEMPAEFDLVALQAQAIAARTYAVKKLADAAKAKAMGAKPSAAPGGALVSDTVSDQAYLPDSALASKWGIPERADKLKRAVESTAGLVLTYENEPIFPAFFSTSGGRTENSENYWGQQLPYLRSVDSPWEADLSPRATTTVTLDAGEVARKLGLPKDVPASGDGAPRLVEKTEGGQVKSVRIGGRTFTGREVREKLGLPSAQFTWKMEGSGIVFTVSGYGHGVGMSQWGAQGMAIQGYGTREILQHYYSGVSVSSLTDAMLRPLS